MIVRELSRKTPQVPVLSEESSDQIGLEQRLAWDRYWLVDPLDGTREFLHKTGEFVINIALMEDVAASAKLKRLGRPLCLSARVTTSSRRWRQHGVWRTILLMWRLRLAYFFGGDPKSLARHYGYVPKQS